MLKIRSRLEIAKKKTVKVILERTKGQDTNIMMMQKKDAKNAA